MIRRCILFGDDVQIAAGGQAERIAIGGGESRDGEVAKEQREKCHGDLHHEFASPGAGGTNVHKEVFMPFPRHGHIQNRAGSRNRQGWVDFVGHDLSFDGKRRIIPQPWRDLAPRTPALTQPGCQGQYLSRGERRRLGHDGRIRQKPNTTKNCSVDGSVVCFPVRLMGRFPVPAKFRTARAAKSVKERRRRPRNGAGKASILYEGEVAREAAFAGWRSQKILHLANNGHSRASKLG